MLRATPRHGTQRRLSALSIAILALSLERFARRARDEWHRLLAGLASGTPRRRPHDDASAHSNAARLVAPRVPPVRERRHPRPRISQWRAIRYWGVPRPTVDGLIAAALTGRYFNRHIRNRFPYERLA